MKFFKKGQDISWQNLIGILIAIIIIVGTFKFFAGLVSFFYGGEKASQITLSNFDALTNTVKELSENDDETVTEFDFPFNLELDYVVVGFDKGSIGIISKCGKEIKVEKPLFNCGELACICLYKREIFESNERRPEKCVTYDVNYIFTHSTENLNFVGGLKSKLPILYDKIPYSLEPENLVIYGHCGVADSEPLGVINLDFIKYVKEGEKAILISPS